MKKLFLLIISFTFLAFNTCDENPINGDDVKPGRRDYIWSVDTIPALNTSMRDLWGSSPTDIWICGDADNRRESVIHYDGNNFTPSGEYILAPTSLWGTAPDNIWLGTAYSQLWHYDGIKWTKHTDLSFPGYTDVVIQSICGINASNIYATGMAINLDSYRGVILIYNGIDWKFIDVPEIRVNFHQISFDASSNSKLIAAANFDHVGTPERIYLFGNGVIKEIYSGEIEKVFGYINKDVFIYIIETQEIFSYSNGSLKLFLNLKNSNYGGGVWGRSTKDFFCSTIDSQTITEGIGHYNGKDLITLFYTDLRFFNPIIFSNEIFFIGYDVNDFTQVIIKGEINN